MLCKISRMAEISVFEQTKIVPQSKLRISTGDVKFTHYLELLHDCEFLPAVVSLPAMALYSLGNQGNQGAAEFMALGHHCHPSSLCSQLSEKMPPIAKEYNAAGRTDLLCTKFLASQVVLNGNSSCNLLSMIVFTVKILPGPFALPIWFQFLIWGKGKATFAKTKPANCVWGPFLASRLGKIKCYGKRQFLQRWISPAYLKMSRVLYKSSLKHKSNKYIKLGILNSKKYKWIGMIENKFLPSEVKKSFKTMLCIRGCLGLIIVCVWKFQDNAMKKFAIQCSFHNECGLYLCGQCVSWVVLCESSLYLLIEALTPS